ncbi:MAG: NAD(P)-dependent dehydrogenase (short-subunit alcohol dehydrogenase family) [Candidatus Azotimanducaceae bacterium]|jgi:retinol dehydrogenase-12
MKDKIVLITGGNSGIGKVTATDLAKRGAKVFIACRDSAKTQAALVEINAVAAVPVENLPVELGSLTSVRKLIDLCQSKFDQLDVLINNAGVFPMKKQLTEDGFEMQFGVNHLSHFLLTQGLLENLKKCDHARVITVSSKLHKSGVIDFDSFKGEKSYNSQTAYGQSKLANVLFAVELAKRLKGTGVTSNALHPGAVRTDIVRDLPWIVRKVIYLMFIGVEKGAQTNIKLATDESLTSVTGKYFDQTKLDECSPLADDTELRERLWTESERLVS